MSEHENLNLGLLQIIHTSFELKKVDFEKDKKN